jgi:TBPIP/Hop2 winged helix domain
MEIDQITLKTMLDKMNRPVHVSYIARYILKQELDVTTRVMEHLITENQIEESEFGKQYYVRKSS